MKTDRWRAGSTLAVALNSTGTGPRFGTYSSYQPSASPLARNASHCSSSRSRSLGGVNSSIVRQGTSSRAIPSSSQAAAFPVTQRRWSSAISIGCRDRSNAARRRTTACGPNLLSANACAPSPTPARPSSAKTAHSIRIRLPHLLIELKDDWRQRSGRRRRRRRRPDRTAFPRRSEAPPRRRRVPRLSVCAVGDHRVVRVAHRDDACDRAECRLPQGRRDIRRRRSAHAWSARMPRPPPAPGPPR